MDADNGSRGAEANTFFQQTSDTATQPQAGFEPVVIDVGALPDDGGACEAPAAQDDCTYRGVYLIAAFFHIAFKLGAVLTFQLGSLVVDNYVVVSVITILFAVADFWTTKHITGPLLVALRWWTEAKEDGSTRWVFESAPENDNHVNAHDNWFFWLPLGAYTMAWVDFWQLNFFKLKWNLVAVFGFELAIVNLIAYIKCRHDARAGVSQLVSSKAMQNPHLVTQVASNFFGAFGSSSK